MRPPNEGRGQIESSGKQRIALVTGSSGFVGRCLVATLLEHGWTVQELTERRSSSSRSAGRQSIDVRDLAAVMRGLRRFRRDARPITIFHLAARTREPDCEKNPKLALQVNLGGTANLLLASRSVEIDAFVFVSTALVYAQHADPATEETPLRPNSIYSASKAAAEQLVRGFSAQYGLPSVTLRPTNIYGPGASEDSVAGRVLAQLARGECVRVKTLSPSRDFLFVEDLAGAMWHAAGLASSLAPVFNVGTGSSLSVGEFCRIAYSVAGRPERIEEEHPSRTLAGNVRAVDTSALKGTGWEPRFSIQRGILRTLEQLDTQHAIGQRNRK